MSGSPMFFDELAATGNMARLKNQLKARHLMMMAANFADDGFLARLRGFLSSLGPEEWQGFQAFLDERGYLSPNRQPARRILEKIAALSLNTMPEDAFLRQAVEHYNRNLEAIDALKRQTLETIDGDELTDLVARINALNDENIALLESVRVPRPGP